MTRTEALDETRGSANHRDGTPFSVSVLGPEFSFPDESNIDCFSSPILDSMMIHECKIVLSVLASFLCVVQSMCLNMICIKEPRNQKSLISRVTVATISNPFSLFAWCLSE